MRPIVAVGILLIGLNGGPPERNQEPLSCFFRILRNAPWMGE